MSRWRRDLETVLELEQIESDIAVVTKSHLEDILPTENTTHALETTVSIGIIWRSMNQPTLSEARQSIEIWPWR